MGLKLRMMDNVIYANRPNVVARFQRQGTLLGEPSAVLVFPGKRAVQVPLRMVKRTDRPWKPAKSIPTLAHVTQASKTYNRLYELKGWSPAKCRRRAKAVGLTVQQVLEALEE